MQRLRFGNAGFEGNTNTESKKIKIKRTELHANKFECGFARKARCRTPKKKLKGIVTLTLCVEPNRLTVDYQPINMKILNHIMLLSLYSLFFCYLEILHQYSL